MNLHANLNEHCKLAKK